MIKITDLCEGCKVHYQPEHYASTDRFENGVVKEIRKGRDDVAWIVYNCGGNWDSYAQYTGACTNLRDLRLGWK